MSTTESTDDEATPGRGYQYSREDILNHLRRAASESDNDTLTTEGYETYRQTASNAPALSVVIDRFSDPDKDDGGWVLAKQAAGIGGDGRRNNARPRKYSNEDMREMLRECERRHGRASQTVFDADDDFCSSGAIVKRFGSWSQGKEEAGLE